MICRIGVQQLIMDINLTKGNIVHFRPKSFQRTDNLCFCGEEPNFDLVDKYTSTHLQ